MFFSKIDLERIKNKILLSNELEKKTRIIKKGKDYWCCCPFHEEKTPSCKLNDDQGSFYCFGCGTKGDIFTIYTDLYNYSFQDAVEELAQRAGVQIKSKEYKNIKQDNIIREILNLSCEWFQSNLQYSEADGCIEYLKSRKLSKNTIDKFKLGYSFRVKETLFQYLKEKSFEEKDIIKSNVVKIDSNNKIKDYFYKRLIFPIEDERGKVVAFGGRSLDNSEPKYINSPESEFFHKRNILYNLFNAKNAARKKNNLLICEGYMDVISLYQHNIQSVVAPLGTALTENQLSLAWKYTSKPTLMFDGDKAGLRASFKTAIMSLSKITPKRFLQFIVLEEGYDPDSFINTYSFNEFLDIIKKPQQIVDFIFNESSKTISLNNADEKIIFDKYLDEIIETIKDKKIKYFYKNEFKKLFFNKIKQKQKNTYGRIRGLKKINNSLFEKQILSFIAGLLNQVSIRKKLLNELLKSDLIKDNIRNLLTELQKSPLINQSVDIIKNSFKDDKNDRYLKIINDSLDSSIYQLFPYSSPKYEAQKSLEEILKSLQNLNTRLLNLKKINKSLDIFVNNSNQLNWNELQNINIELLDDY